MCRALGSKLEVERPNHIMEVWGMPSNGMGVWGMPSNGGSEASHLMGVWGKWDGGKWGSGASHLMGWGSGTSHLMGVPSPQKNYLQF